MPPVGRVAQVARAPAHHRPPSPLRTSFPHPDSPQRHAQPQPCRRQGFAHLPPDRLMEAPNHSWATDLRRFEFPHHHLAPCGRRRSENDSLAATRCCFAGRASYCADCPSHAIESGCLGKPPLEHVGISASFSSANHFCHSVLASDWRLFPPASVLECHCESDFEQTAENGHLRRLPNQGVHPG